MRSNQQRWTRGGFATARALWYFASTMADEHIVREAGVGQPDLEESGNAGAADAVPLAAVDAAAVAAAEEPRAAVDLTKRDAEPHAAVAAVAAAEEPRAAVDLTKRDAEPHAAVDLTKRDAEPQAAVDLTKRDAEPQAAVASAEEPEAAVYLTRRDAEPHAAVAVVAVMPEVAPPAAVELAEEPDYPPPNSVPRPQPPSSLRVYPPPRVDEITPANGSVLGETKLTLVGANLFRASIVRVGGIIAQTVGADEPRELRVLTPPGERAGEVDVTVENPHVAPAVVAKGFRYTALAAPRIVSVAPDHVKTKGGTELTVMGENFVKSTVVLFDGKPVTSARFVGATTIDVTAPPGEHGKLVDVSVRNPDGETAVARRAFMYDERFG